MVCLTYGKPQRQLMLDFNDYDENGLTIDGPNGLWPVDAARFAGVTDRPPKMRPPRPGAFCPAGYISPTPA